MSRRKEGGAETDEEDRKPPPLSGGMTAHPKNPGKPTRMTAHTKREFSKVAENEINTETAAGEQIQGKRVDFVCNGSHSTHKGTCCVGGNWEFRWLMHRFCS